MAPAKLIKVLCYSPLICLLICLFLYGLIRKNIQSSLNRLCLQAQESHPHPGDDIAALIAYMNSESHELRQRNLAVWALGQLRSSRALSALKEHYTGNRCDHEKNLCQHELKKAIKSCEEKTPNLLFLKNTK
jgi:hypothetical protein